MKSEFKKYRLGELTRWASGGTPAKSIPEYWEGDIPWISASSMNSLELHDSEKRITNLGLNSGSRLAKKGSVLILVRGSILHQRIPFGITSRNVAFNQDVKCISIKDERLDPWYLLFWLKYKQAELMGQVEFTGIGAGKLDLKILKNSVIKIPQRSVMGKIVSILKAIEGKRALALRVSQTLESIAQAIFKSWFVDFDPVRAKEEASSESLESFSEVGKEYTNGSRLEQSIMALFPKALSVKYSKKIPEGWTLKQLKEIIEVNPKLRLKKDVEAAYLDMKNLPTAGPFPAQWDKKAFKSGMKFCNEDTLVARITPCLENGKTGMVHFLSEGEIGWGSTEFIVLRSKPPVPPFFAYLLARDKDFRNILIQNMTGTSGRQRVKADVVESYETAVPSDMKLFELFGELVKPIQKLIENNTRLAQTLAELRDALLPKLMSGEIEVPDAEAAVADIL